MNSLVIGKNTFNVTILFKRNIYQYTSTIIFISYNFINFIFVLYNNEPHYAYSYRGPQKLIYLTMLFLIFKFYYFIMHYSKLKNNKLIELV